jgi:hypothetical protein
MAFPERNQFVLMSNSRLQLTDLRPVDKILGSVDGKTGKQMESRVYQKESIAYQNRRWIGRETRNDWVDDCGRHVSGQVDDFERETRRDTMNQLYSWSIAPVGVKLTYVENGMWLSG